MLQTNAIFREDPAYAALIDEGCALLDAMQFTDAAASFSAACCLEPRASAPRAWMALAYSRASALADTAADAERYARDACAAGRHALALDPRDPLALGTLGAVALARRACDPCDPAVRAAREAFARGLDRLSLADPAGAEARFSEATWLDPLDAQAWCFLADALLAQSRRPEAEDALLASVEANPGYLPAWQRLDELRHCAGRALVPMRLPVAVTLERDAAARRPTVIRLDATLVGSAVEQAPWMVYAATRDDPAALAAGAGPFARERAAFSAMLVHVRDQLRHERGNRYRAEMRMLLAVAELGHLDAAIFSLYYDESFRAEYEAFKLAHPHAMRDFVDRMGLRPY